jgi:hypothetical protein
VIVGNAKIAFVILVLAALVVGINLAGGHERHQLDQNGAYLTQQCHQSYSPLDGDKAAYLKTCIAGGTLP